MSLSLYFSLTPFSTSQVVSAAVVSGGEREMERNREEEAPPFESGVRSSVGFGCAIITRREQEGNTYTRLQLLVVYILTAGIFFIGTIFAVLIPVAQFIFADTLLLQGTEEL